MNLSPRNRGRHSLPPAVLALLVFEFILTTILLLLGVAWLSLLAYAGPAIAFTLALLNPTVQELGRRQPKLSVTTKEGGLVLIPSAARPWPVDAQRVLANELDEARETTKRRHSVLDDFMNVGGPFVVRPSEATISGHKKSSRRRSSVSRPSYATG